MFSHCTRIGSYSWGIAAVATSSGLYHLYAYLPCHLLLFSMCLFYIYLRGGAVDKLSISTAEITNVWVVYDDLYVISSFSPHFCFLKMLCFLISRRWVPTDKTVIMQQHRHVLFRFLFFWVCYYSKIQNIE